MGELVNIRSATHIICECITCGVAFTVPQVVHERHRREGGFHYCSNGHGQGWHKGSAENDMIRQERDRLKQQIAQRDDEAKRLRDGWEGAERRAASEKAARVRIERRVLNGVCPDCNRTFADLASHMKVKHGGRVCEAIETDRPVLRKGMSAENRAAAAERMRAMHARRKAEREA